MTLAPADARTSVALDDARGAFLLHVEERRLRLFRACLQASVGWASPLALSFARQAGLGLDDVMQVMTPPPFWPQSDGPIALPQVRWILPARRLWKGGGDDRLMWRVARGGGHAMRVGGGGDWVGWRVSGDTVEVAARLGTGTLITNRGTLRLWIPHNLPATVCAAMPGRALASLVDHPWLADEALTVASVGDHGAGGHVVRVRAGRRRFAAPWPATLAGVMLIHGGASLADFYARES